MTTNASGDTPPWQPPAFTDILVDTTNPEGLDAILQTFGAALIGGGMPDGYVKEDGHYVMRVFGDPGFVRFAVAHQGYGTVVGETTAWREG